MSLINYKDYPVIIMSCDGYSDIWEPMTRSLEKFWPDCPFPIYLCSETKSFDHYKIENIRVGRKMGWSEMLIHVLNELHSENVIYLQEDYILKGATNNEDLNRLLEFFERINAAYLRLVPYPPPENVDNEELNVGRLEKGSSYRTSLQAAVWDREVFLQMLDPKENGWEFEKNSISRSAQIERPFYSMALNSVDPNKNLHTYPLDYYSTAILQGKWQKEAVKMLRKAGIPIDTKKRGCLTRWDFFYYHQQKRGSSFYFPLLKAMDRFVFNRRKKYRKY